MAGFVDHLIVYALGELSLRHLDVSAPDGVSERALVDHLVDRCRATRAEAETAVRQLVDLRAVRKVTPTRYLRRTI